MCRLCSPVGFTALFEDSTPPGEESPAPVSWLDGVTATELDAWCDELDDLFGGNPVSPSQPS